MGKLEVFAIYAGIGGLGLAVLLTIFSKILTEKIFGVGGITKAQRFKVLCMLIAGVFVVTLVSIGVYAYQLSLENGGSQVAMCDNVPTTELRANGWTHFTNLKFASAERVADKLLVCDETDFEARNILGAVAFYQRNYGRAVAQFRRAVEIAPGKHGLGQNLADALVELAMHGHLDGDPERKKLLREAVAEYERRGHGEWTTYKVARAKLFLKNYTDAINDVRDVKDRFGDEGGMGKARILEGAIYSCLAAENKSSQEEHMTTAELLFKKGYALDKGFWNDIIANNAQHNAEPFEHVIACYGEAAIHWASAS